jgi:PAS domain S-box-containing protein
VSTDPRSPHDLPTADPFVAAVRGTRMPMIITDPRLDDNPIVFANDAFCRLTGYERSEILGRNCRFLQGPETDPATVRRLHDAVHALEPIHVDILNYRKSGEPFWNRLLLAPVRSDAGEVTYFFASQVDASSDRVQVSTLEGRNAVLVAELAERLRAQEASEARLTMATRAGGLGVWDLDVATRTLVASAGCKAHFGIPADEPFDHARLLDCVHPDDRERMQAAVRHSIETGEDYEIEYRVLRPDGAPGWVRIVAAVLRDAEGRSVRMTGISQDVTQATLAREASEMLIALDRDVFAVVEDPSEIAYRAAEALGRTLGVSRAGYGTIVAADETIVIERDWNQPGIRTIAGTLHFRDYGTYIEDLKRGETVVVEDARQDPRTRDTADALIGISAQSFVNMPVTEDGGLVALLFLNHRSARHWTPEEMVLLSKVAHRTRQAVERRRAEQELRAAADRLESEVAERTAELVRSQAALRQAQKMEAVGQLTGGLAHDFNNLLASISGSFDLLRRRQPEGMDPKIDRYLETGRSGVRKAAALTHRLLAFSRQQTLEPRHLDARRLIASLEDLVRRTIGPSIALEVVGAVGLWTVFADPGQLENAILNLCINARDAMPNGGRLTLETANRWIDARSAQEQQMVPGQYVAICVSDDGAGMTPEVAARAFDPFFTTKPIGAGTGLGLSMVYGFAQQSGGQARIYSEVGKGTTVCIYLPRQDGAVDPEPAADQEHPPLEDRHSTVLVVDDEPAVRAVMVEVLQDQGFRILEAPDGPSAVQILRSPVGIDLLVTDVGLPGGMNGRQVAEAGRAARPDLRVLFVTGYAENAALGHGHLAPGMHVMTKPFDLNRFGQRVADLVEEGLRKTGPGAG